MNTRGERAAWAVLAAACGQVPTSSTTGDPWTSSASATGEGAAVTDGASVTTLDGTAAPDPSSSSGASEQGSTTTSDSTTGEPGAPPQTCGALANIPSEPGPHVAEIEALAADEWLALGAPAADREFGVARGRSWGGRALVLAQDLRGAFYTGEGQHAYVKPDGYGMDDVWFYDINGHAWITIHPGVNTATFNQQVIDGELSIDDNGQLQDANGHPVPLHIKSHAWDFLTFDSKAQRFVIFAGDGMGRFFMPGEAEIDVGLTMLEEQRATIEIPPMSPWFYSVPDCAFERYPITTPAPDVGGFAAFIYASVTDEYVYAGAGGAAVFDRTSNVWTVAADSGPRPTGYDHGVAYDSMRNRLYMGSGDGASQYGLFIYDIGTSTWTNPAPAGLGPSTFRTNSASVFYDTANDVVTVFHYKDRVHYTFDPNANTWTSQELPSEVLDAVGWASFNAFYDTVSNAYFLYAASDSGADGTMFAYRWATP
jgi:hypothetical protein